MGKKLKKLLCWTKGFKKGKQEEEKILEKQMVLKEEPKKIEKKEIVVKDIKKESNELRAKSIMLDAQSSLAELNVNHILNFVDFNYIPSPDSEYHRGYTMVKKQLPFLQHFHTDPEEILEACNVNMLESYSELIYDNILSKVEDEEIAYNRTVSTMEMMLSSLNYLHECVFDGKQIDPIYYFTSIRILSYLYNRFPITHSAARATTICDIFRLGLFINTLGSDDIRMIETIKSYYSDELTINNTIIRFPKITFYDGSTKIMPKKQREALKLQFNEIYQKFQMLQSSRENQNESNTLSLGE